MHELFVSYATTDREHAQALAAALEAEGLSVWWDRVIPAGKSFGEVIDRALSSAKCIIVLWSARSIVSNWVLDEASEGLSRNILVPVLIEQVRIPLGFRRIQAADLSGWNGDHQAEVFRRLLNDLRSVVGGVSSREADPYSIVTAKRRDDAPKPQTDKRKPARLEVRRPNPTIVEVPGGQYRQQWEEEQEGRASGRRPGTVVKVATFGFAREPVTNDEFCSFVQATRRRLSPRVAKRWGADTPPPEKAHEPVVWVPWAAAVAYCKWASAVSGAPYRLPTEDEWERAVALTNVATWEGVREWTADTFEGEYFVVRGREKTGRLIRSVLVGSPKASIGFRLARNL